MKEVKWNKDEKIVKDLCPNHTLEIEPYGSGIKLMTYWLNDKGERKIVGLRIIDSKSLMGGEM